VVPRTRETRLRRPPPYDSSWEVGDLTCPRCGWPANYLIKPYHESPWIEHGGMCGRCCQQAAEHHDSKKWPPPREPYEYLPMTWPGQMPESDAS
jgi:hypothetical protein